MNIWAGTGKSRRFVVTLLCATVAVHLLMALSLGAKFWFDSVTYFQLAEGLATPGALRSLYAGPFGIIFQHLMPGLPFLILLFERVFGSNMWPAFVVLQNAFAALACVYLATSLSKHFGKAAQLAIVTFIPLFPYFSAFHNAILTESLTSSLVMIMVGITIRCLENRLGSMRGLVAILLLGVLGAQIRSYIIGISGGLSLLIVFFSIYRRQLWVYLTVGATVAFGVMSFPLYRMATGTELFLPNVDSLMLMHAHYWNWNLDDRSRRALDGVVLDPKIIRKLTTSDSQVEVGDVIDMVDALVNTGISRQEAIRKIGRAGWILRTQSWDVMARQLQLSLSSLGFQWLSTCCEKTRVLAFDNFTGEKLSAHLQRWYRWNAGVDAGDYVALFRIFDEMYRPAPYYTESTIDWYKKRVEGFVVAHPDPLRDVFQLSTVAPDVLIAAGLFGFVLVSRRDKRLIAILVFLMALNYAASLSAGLLGDNRYAHLLWPFYLVGIVALLDRTLQFAMHSASRHRKSNPPDLRTAAQSPPRRDPLMRINAVIRSF